MELNFLCGICVDMELVFRTTSSFFAHLKTHSNKDKNKYLCLQNGCYKYLKDMNSFQKHVNNHVAEGNLNYKYIINIYNVI